MATLVEALSRIADAAIMNGRDPPVIETDLASALLIMEIIGEELGSQTLLREPAFRRPPGQVGMFDGVRIMRRGALGQQGWREHFGVLADIWEASGYVG